MLSANNLLFLVFSAMMALLLVSGFLSRLVLAGLEVELRCPGISAAARAPTPARIRVRNIKRLTPSFSIELAGRKDPITGLPSILKAPVYFPVVPSRESMEAAVQVNFPRRGRHVDNVFVISTRFPFGFLRRTTAVELRRETLVYPALEPTGGGRTAAGRGRRRDESFRQRYRARFRSHPPLGVLRQCAPRRLEKHGSHR